MLQKIVAVVIKNNAFSCSYLRFGNNLDGSYALKICRLNTVVSRGCVKVLRIGLAIIYNRDRRLLA